MKRDIRNGIKSSFLYKTFAYYQSEGFIALIKFLKDENLYDDFWEEFSFSKSIFERNFFIKNRKIKLGEFFDMSSCSFSFMESKLGSDFWYQKIFGNENFKKISGKIL